MKLIAPGLTDSLWIDNPGSWGCEPADIWSMLCAALEGDVSRVRTLAGREPDVTMPFESGLPAATNYGLPEREFSKKYRKALEDLTGRLIRPATSLADTVQDDTQI